MNHETYHTEWQTSRINFIMSKYPAEFFNGKRILELAGFNGHIANHFSKLGATVDCIEGRQENVNYINRKFPHLNTEVFNLDTEGWLWGHYDIIINFGLFYHLENFHEAHLINCIRNCDLMFFETVVYDSPDAELYFASEHGQDQSLSGRAGTPSTSYVENIFNKENVNHTIYKDASLNGGMHTYDWKDTFERKYHVATRRFWIVQK